MPITSPQTGTRNTRSRSPHDLTGRHFRDNEASKKNAPTVESLAEELVQLRALVLSLSSVVSGHTELIHGSEDYTGILQRLEYAETGEISQ
jgi:hypothetical protein